MAARQISLTWLSVVCTVVVVQKKAQLRRLDSSYLSISCSKRIPCIVGVEQPSRPKRGVT